MQKLRQLEFYSLIKQAPAELVGDQPRSLPQPNIGQIPVVVTNRSNPVEAWNKIDWQKPVLVANYCAGRFGQDLKWLVLSQDQKQAQFYDWPILKKLVSQTDWPEKITIWGHDCQQASQAFFFLGRPLESIEVAWDIKVVSFLLNPGHRQQSLSALANHYLEYSSEIDDLSPADFNLKAPEILALIYQIKKIQEGLLKKRSQTGQIWRPKSNFHLLLF